MSMRTLGIRNPTDLKSYTPFGVGETAYKPSKPRKVEILRRGNRSALRGH